MNTSRVHIVVWLLVPTLIIIGLGTWILTSKTSGEIENTIEGQADVIVYKSPSCGCCVKYIAYLEKQGYTVQVENTHDTDSIKISHQIPNDLYSCHTAEFGNYFVEGHVPIEAVNKMLSEKPEIDGIALAGMPAGSPGMPGVKKEKFNISSLNNGIALDFIEI